MATGRCKRKKPSGRRCGRIILDTRGKYLAIGDQSHWVLLCNKCSGELESLLEPFLLDQESAPWLTSKPIEVLDGMWLTAAEIRNALAMFTGGEGHRRTGFLSAKELNVFRGLLRGAVSDVDGHASDKILALIRAQIQENRAKS